MITALTVRFDQGYGIMFQANQRPEPWIPPSLSHNLGLFWEAIFLVSANGHQRLEDGDFKDENWAFNLIRIIAEGFIEGHAAYFQQFNPPPPEAPQISGYIVNSTSTWTRVLRAIENDITLDSLNNNANLSQTDKDDAWEIVTLGILPRWLARFWIDLITPGTQQEQEMAFWLVHVPHWFGDLLQALRENGKRDPALSVDNKHDWDLFEEVIITGAPSSGDLWDILVSDAAVLALSIAPNSEFNPRNILIERIFEMVRSRV